MITNPATSSSQGLAVTQPAQANTSSYASTIASIARRAIAATVYYVVYNPSKSLLLRIAPEYIPSQTAPTPQLIAAPSAPTSSQPSPQSSSSTSSSALPDGALLPSNGIAYSETDMTAIYSLTEQVLDQGYYPYQGKHVQIGGNTLASVIKTEKQKAIKSADCTYEYEHKKYQTKFSVSHHDAVFVATTLKTRGFRPVLVNPANARDPGGGYKTGACSMEEDLCLRSALSLALDVRNQKQKTNFYPLHYSALLYTPGVPFFRRGLENYYAFFPKSETLSVITSAAIDLQHDTFDCPHDKKQEGCHFFPKCKDGKPYSGSNDPAFIDETKRRIYAQLQTAADHDHDSVVLPAFGCGAFLNDPQVVASIYKEVIDTKFEGAFKKIVFAIPDDPNARKTDNPEGNAKPLRDIFGVDFLSTGSGT